MLTYALFIATDPDPVSSSDWSHIDEVLDRARLSSGGTKVHVRATETPGTAEEDFEIDVATFVNGIQLEVRDDGPQAFTYLGDGRVLGSAQLSGDEWQLSRAAEGDAKGGEPVATFPAAEQTHDEAGVRLRRMVEDWLS